MTMIHSSLKGFIKLEENIFHHQEKALFCIICQYSQLPHNHMPTCTHIIFCIYVFVLHGDCCWANAFAINAMLRLKSSLCFSVLN